MTEPQNLTRKLLADHLAAGNLVPGEELDLRVDQILIEDATGSMTALQFEALEPDRIEVPLAVMYVDHNVLQIDDKNMDEHRFLRSFSARYGVHYSRPGNGISHYVHLERFARPSSPGNVVPVREVAGTGTVQVCVGSSVNSSYEDLATVASVLKESIVHPEVEMTVTPGSRQILDTISRSGVYQDFVAAGARMLEPVCGPCIGVGQAPSAGVPSVRTFNRNFPGRSGTPGDEVYLCSPATAAATALRGEISDPRELGEPPDVTHPATNPAMDDRQILAPPSPDEARSIEVVWGPNIVSPPEGRPLPEALEGRVVIVVEDDVSTGDMAPDGALGMSLWSNIPECAKYMFRRQDPEFHDRALEWGGGFIVGGHNYGQGSSREHAALAPLHLGIRAVIARSFARIHRRNLIGQGILPLLFADEEDYERVKKGDTWKIEGVREAVRSGATELVAKSDASDEIPLEARLLPREREVLLAGGMLRHLREGGQERIGIVEGDSASAESGGRQSGGRSA